MCNECLQIPCHPRCPNYEPPEADCYCEICNEGIYEGDEYIEDYSHNCVHLDCFDTTKDLIEWLGYEIKIMRDNY